MSLRLLHSVAILAVLAAASAITTAATAGEVRGRVVVDGQPAPGAAVSVLAFEDAFAAARREARREDLPKPLVAGTTRPDGTFALALPAAATGAVVRLLVSATGGAPFLLGRLLDAGGEDVGDVRLGKAAAIAGRVVDERGGPMVGATVTLWAGRGRGMDDLSTVEASPRAATTKPDGTFRFEAAGAEGNRLRFEAPGFATQERTGLRSGALVKPVTMTLGRTLRGSVTLSDARGPKGGPALVRFEGRTTTRWVEARPDGSFLIDGAPAEAGAVVADAGDRGRASLPVAAGAAGPLAIVLAPTASLRGRAVEADTARPLAGVRLVVRGEGTVFLARSGAEGRYEVRGLSPQRYRLSADDDRFVPWTRSVTVVAGQAEDQDVPLVRGATLAGRVVGEDGAPIEGAIVSLTRPGENPVQAFVRRMEGGDEATIRTLRDGSFRASRLMPGENQRLDVRHDEYEERSVGGIDLAAGRALSGVSVVLRRGLTVRGIVKDEAGRPLAGVEVQLSRPFEFQSRRGGVSFSFIGPGTTPRKETGADGRFEFRGLKAGDYSLGANRRGLVRASVDPVKVSEGRAAETIEITLKPGVTISGYVRDRAGAPAPGWYVSARPSGEGGGPAFGPGSPRTPEPTGPDGAFVLEGLAEGASYDLQLLGAAGLGSRRAGVAAPADDVEMSVTGSGQIRGQVMDAESGRPVTDFQVSYAPDAQGGMRVMFRGPGGRSRGMGEPQPFHAEDGVFVLEEVPAGKWTVQATAAGYQKGSAASVTVEEGGAAEGVEVRLSKGGVVAGRVLESRTGRPVLDATVRAELSGGGPGGMIRIGGGPAENEASTDAEGKYELAGLAPGTWTLTASHPEWSETTSSVELKEAPVTADIRLGRGGSVGGSVTAGGRPVPGAQVGLAPAGDAGMGMMRGGPFGSEQGALTDEGGRFRFDRLTPGRYTLSASLRSQSSAPAEVVLTGEESQDVALALAEGTVVHGTVSGLADAARGGVNVSASGPDQFFASTRTAADGTFELAGVPEGTIHLTANAGDFLTSTRSASTTVTIAPGQAEAVAEIVFEQGYRIDGRVTRGGRPVPEAMVFAMPEGGGRRTASAQTDESGGFVLEGLQEGEYTITASASRQPAPIRRKVTVSGDTTVDLEAPPARIGGTVVETGTGRPLGEVMVRIEDEGGGMRFVTTATTDSTGRFSFEDIEPKEYRLSFQKPAYQAETRQVTAADDSEVRVEMRRGEGIALVARDGLFATPLRGLMVRVVDGSGAVAFSGNVPLDSDGHGEVPALKPGSYELRADSSGYAPVRRPVSVPSSELALVLTPGGSLEIQTGPQTLALPQASARLIGADGRVYLPYIFSNDGKIRLVGPSRTLENVAPGSYTLEVEGGVRREVAIAEGGRAVVSLP
jgi:protocatechuate 3,4-dioxygenase beta subunit